MKRVSVFCVGLAFWVMCGAVAAQDKACTATTCAYLDSALSPEARATDLVRRMTLEEKVGQTLDRAPAIARLGVPEYNWWNEGLHGVARSGVATVFPQAIGLAAMWDPKLVQRVADVISTEARARHNEAVAAAKFTRYTGLTYWSPNINIFRDPRWGRGQETYGEDPFLTASTGVAFIRGLQGDDPRYYKVVATPKHFAVHSGPEPGRHGFNVNPSAFDLEDTYLPAFRAAITEAKADSIMCAYNAVDGVPACASKMLLQTYLRDAWGFKGFVVSDCDAIDDVRKGHHYAADNAHASAVSVEAGTDLDCGSAYKDLGVAVQQGLLPGATLDTALVRLFTARFRLGMFDPEGAVPFNRLGTADINTAAHRALALQAARESVVLLQNGKGVLPLKTGVKIAVVGPTAELLQAVEGNYNGASAPAVLPLNGMKKMFGAERVFYNPGAPLADGASSAVPSSALHPAAGSAAHGLMAEYFDNQAFSGAAKVKRVDAMINFDWDNSSPAAELKTNKPSIRWSGVIDLPAAGAYTFEFRGIPRPKKGPDVTGEGGTAYAGAVHLLRVYLDEKLVMDSAAGQFTATFTAAARGTHALRVEYVRVGNDRAVSLGWTVPAGALLADALETAKAADVVVAFVGLSPDLEGEQMSVHIPGFDGGDRTTIDLPEVQEQMLEALKKTGKPLVVVLTSGSAVALNWADAHADAVLQAWYGGEEAGTAIAETLTGRNNPSGRLPVTFYRGTKDLPAFDDYAMKGRTYRYFKGPVLYPFGFGLSYAKFTFGAASVARETIKAGEAAEVKTSVRNDGSLDGDEIVEVYADLSGGKSGSKPVLVGFERVHVAAGATVAVSVSIAERQLSQVDAQGGRAVKAGRYTLFVGDGQPTMTAADKSAALTIVGEKVLPR